MEAIRDGMLLPQREDHKDKNSMPSMEQNVFSNLQLLVIQYALSMEEVNQTVEDCQLLLHVDASWDIRVLSGRP